MTTITINERTKAGKSLLELAKILSVSNKGVIINSGPGLNATSVATKPLTTKQRTLINRLKRVKKDVDSGNMKKFRPINELLDEI